MTENEYLSFSERVKQRKMNTTDTEISRIAFFLAYRVKNHFIRTRLSWKKAERDEIERYGRTNRKTLSPEVSPDSIEESALAARCVLLMHWNDRDESGKFPMVEDSNGKKYCPIIRKANKAAREAFNREMETDIEAIPEPCVDETNTEAQREKAFECFRIYADSIRSIRSYWKSSKSRKSKSGLKADLNRLSLITRYTLGQGESKPMQSDSVRKSMQRLRERIAKGELIRYFE